MKFKNFLSIIMAIIICVSSVTILAFAEVSSEGEMPTLPPSEEVEVTVLYAPIKSRIMYNKSGPFIDGMILKITYYDGHYEILKVQRVGNKPDNKSNVQNIYENVYKAGDFTVYIFPCFFLEAMGQPSNYGTKVPSVYVAKYEKDLLYEGITDFTVLSIPNPIEFFYCIKTIINTNI